MQKVSIVIPTWNRKNDLGKCLTSINKLNYPSIEVIVVDNGSSDGTREMLQNEYPDIKVISNENNLGAPYARNQGILVSSGDYIWFLDNDTEIIFPNTLSHMLDILEAYPAGLAVGGELIVEDNIEKPDSFLEKCFGMSGVVDQDIEKIESSNKEEKDLCELL